MICNKHFPGLDESAEIYVLKEVTTFFLLNVEGEFNPVKKGLYFIYLKILSTQVLYRILKLQFFTCQR